MLVLLLPPVPPLCAAERTLPGNCTSVSKTGNAVALHAGGSLVNLSFYAEDVVRVDYLPFQGEAPDSSFAVIRNPDPAVSVIVTESDSTVAIASKRVRVLCRKYPLRLAFLDAAGIELTAEPPSGGLFARAGERGAQFTIRRHEHFYGTGERGTALDRRGQAFDCYNTQSGGYATALSTMNINVPFIASTAGYGIYCDNTYRCRFDVGASDSTVMSYSAAGGTLTFYFMAAPTLALELERYTWLTGRQPLPPRWAFGFIQSKNRYRNEEEARSIVRSLREKSFPADAIVLDLRWFPRMGDLTWDTASWHDPEGMMTDFLKTGIKTILITEPYVVATSANFGEAARLGYLGRDSGGRAYALDHWWSCGGCDAFLFDMTNPAARQWWWEKHPAFLGDRVAGLWTDLGEPERHPADMMHFLGPAGRIHNIYNLLWARTIFEGMGRFRPGERVFNLTRSGFAGIQRYGAIPWSGDVSRSFGGLAVQIPMLLDMGMSGLAYQNSDIGGYARNPTTSELYVRWMEFGIFTPVTRAHGAGEVVNGSPTEPWMFGPEAEEICRSMLRLRYRLLPYNYTLAFRNYQSGIPLARPLIMMYPREEKFAGESSTYLWGDSFLVSPVVSAGETTKTVDFPPGEWVNYWTDDIVPGGTVRAIAAPPGRIPIFVKSGSIIPMAPVMRFSDERPLDTLTLGVYPGSAAADSAFLYEDDGKTTAYQAGSFSLTKFTLRSKEDDGIVRLAFGVGRADGLYAGKLRSRVYSVEVHRVGGPPAGVLLDGKNLPDLAPDSGAAPAGPGYRFDRRLSSLEILFRCDADNVCNLSLSYPPAK